LVAHSRMEPAGILSHHGWQLLAHESGAMRRKGPTVSLVPF